VLETTVKNQLIIQESADRSADHKRHSRSHAVRKNTDIKIGRNQEVAMNTAGIQSKPLDESVI
jgi:hypothetical protein